MMKRTNVYLASLLVGLSVACGGASGGTRGYGTDSEDHQNGGAPNNTGGASNSNGGATGGQGTTPVTTAEPFEYDGLNGLVRNPIISHVFTADPSAKVFNGRIYVYTSHDLDDQSTYAMRDYHVFSSNDLVNWQDHGVILDEKDVTWTGSLYAPDCAYGKKTGKYYLYFPNTGSGVGVAVSDSPAGPFVDALGKPLVDRNTPGVSDVEWVFDPMCFVDDDGQAYLYFGGGPQNSGDNVRVIRLNDDMISLADATATPIAAPDFFEASFLHKREGKYYFSYSTTFANHSAEIDYLTSDNPMTGFQHVGTILPNPEGNNYNNNHQSIVEYEGNWYIFYHNRVLANRDGFSNYQRSITLDQLSYDASGNIAKLDGTHGTIHQLRPLDAFSRLEGETLADQRGIEVNFSEESGKRVGAAVTDIHDGDWTGYSQVDFGNGATQLRVRVASGSTQSSTIKIYVDGSDRFKNLPGQLIGSCTIEPTGGWQLWKEYPCDIENTEGVHDLYLRYSGSTTEPLLNLDYFQFE
jgi:arabinoxylan arabinofuranohydrolase